MGVLTTEKSTVITIDTEYINKSLVNPGVCPQESALTGNIGLLQGGSPLMVPYVLFQRATLT